MSILCTASDSLFRQGAGEEALGGCDSPMLPGFAILRVPPGSSWPASHQSKSAMTPEASGLFYEGRFCPMTICQLHS